MAADKLASLTFRFSICAAPRRVMAVPASLAVAVRLNEIGSRGALGGLVRPMQTCAV